MPYLKRIFRNFSKRFLKKRFILKKVLKKQKLCKTYKFIDQNRYLCNIHFKKCCIFKRQRKAFLICWHFQSFLNHKHYPFQNLKQNTSLNINLKNSLFPTSATYKFQPKTNILTLNPRNLTEISQFQTSPSLPQKFPPTPNKKIKSAQKQVGSWKAPKQRSTPQEWRIEGGNCPLKKSPGIPCTAERESPPVWLKFSNGLFP